MDFPNAADDLRWQLDQLNNRIAHDKRGGFEPTRHDIERRDQILAALRAAEALRR